MYMWWSLLAGLAVLPIVLKSLFPYLGDDCCYMWRSLMLAARLTRYKRLKPFYSLLDRFVDTATAHPDKTLVHFEGRAYSYGEAERRSNRVANALRSHAGLRAGDAVALFCGNEPAFVWTWLGLAKLGCAAALLNVNIRSRSLLHCFSCCGAKVLIASAELQAAVEEVLPALLEKGIAVYLLSDTCGTEGIVALSEKISQASEQPLSRDLRASVNIKSTALYIYTIGAPQVRVFYTSGLPKAAVVTQERVWTASFIQAVSGVTSDDVFYVNLPLYHSAGFLIGMCGSIERGMTFVLRKKFSASQFWEDCRKHDVTVMQYIGETMRYLCNMPRVSGGNHMRELYGATEGNIGFINYTSKIGAVGRVNVLHRKFFPYLLIKFDIEKEEPVRNAAGLCIEAAKGETGLLVGAITKISPFSGYAGNQQQTEKKRLANVLKKGDLYFNTGDLLCFDHQNFVYFQDRVGDTFRWKGENVATSEVGDTLTMAQSILEANVYGVKVEGHEGRIGMAAVTLKEGEEFDCLDAYKQVVNYLPSYARPYFIRIQPCLELTGTFKMKKVKLVEEGFNPSIIMDPIYFLDTQRKTYVPMTEHIYTSICSGVTKL
ncbi:hypothetical protein CRUP_016632 [Coryphaenoides rupestris]|nr:hypothetical protein CRUP_016632 [Coryphaenoides rupestris]